MCFISFPSVRVYDVVVVGAGPAGATAARLLSRKGYKVLLIEKRKLPRPKLCAGAVSLRADRYLPPDWENAVLNTIYGGNLGWRGERYVKARSEKPVVKIVERSDFDFYLTLKAEDEGTKVHQGETFINFRNLYGDYIEVETDKGTYKAKYLVGADGALSRTLRGYGYERKPVPVVEAIVETRIGDMDEVFIDIGLVKWGYGWVFPHGENRVSVGLASLKGEVKNLRDLLKDYIENHPLLRNGKITSLKGWFIPTSKGSLIKGEGRLFFLGDASGATDAVLGEGIYYAVRQAHIFADCVSDNWEETRKCYERNLKTLEREFLFAYLTGGLAYNFQGLLFKKVQPGDLEKFFQFLRGELNFKDIFLYGVRRFISALSPF